MSLYPSSFQVLSYRQRYIVPLWNRCNFATLFNTWRGWNTLEWMSLWSVWRSSFWHGYCLENFMWCVLLALNIQRLYGSRENFSTLLAFPIKKSAPTQLCYIPCLLLILSWNGVLTSCIVILPYLGVHGYIRVSMEYFAKWIEAMPTYVEDGKTAAIFLFNHIITRFGVP